MKTVSMNRIFFLEPIMPGDLVECVARISYTSLHTVHVRTEVTVIRGLLSTNSSANAGETTNVSDAVDGNGANIISHTGHFVIANFDRAGNAQQVTTGIDLSGDEGGAAGRGGGGGGGAGGTAGDIADYASAQCRRNFLLKNWNALLLRQSPK